MSGRLPGLEQRATRHPSMPRALVIVATVAIGLGVWILRRRDQLLHPYVWEEAATPSEPQLDKESWEMQLWELPIARFAAVATIALALFVLPGSSVTTIQ